MKKSKKRIIKYYRKYINYICISDQIHLVNTRRFTYLLKLVIISHVGDVIGQNALLGVERVHLKPKLTHEPHGILLHHLHAMGGSVVELI